MQPKKQSFKRIVMLVIIIILLNFSFPYSSNAAFVGVLTKPICWLAIQLADGVNFILTAITTPAASNLTDFYNKLNSDGFIDAYHNLFMSPDKIFSNKVDLLKANIFDYSTKTPTSGSFSDWIQDGSTSLASALKSTVANIYVLLRNLAAVILLCLLIYTGIRILITAASPYEQAKWKKALLDWIKALCLLMFSHLIMIGIFEISDLLVSSLSGAFGEKSIVSNIRAAFSNTSIWDTFTPVVITVLYLYITYLTIVFYFAYFKRLTWIVMLTIIAPIVSVTYAIQGQSKIYNTWVKEYIYGVLLQPFHMLIFYVLVYLPLGLTNSSTTPGSWWDTLDPTNQTSLIVNIYVLVAITMIRPAEKFFMNLFGFKQSAVARMGSVDSGEKQMKKTVNGAINVGRIGALAAAALATGGAAAAAAPAAAGAASAGGAAAAEGAAVEGAALSAAETGAVGIEAGTTELAGAEVDMMADEAQLNNGMSTPNIENGELGQDSSNADVTGNSGISNSEGTNELTDAARSATDALNGLAKAANAANISNAANPGENKEINISDKDFRNATGPTLGDKFRGYLEKNESYQKLKNGFEENVKPSKPYELAKGGYEKTKAVVNVLRSDEGKDAFNKLNASLHDLADGMYLDDDAAGGWKENNKQTAESIQNSKKARTEAFVNNKNNINYMQNKYGCNEDEAKARLKKAEPFLNRGITDIGTIDKLITAQEKKGGPPEKAMRAVGKDQKIDSTINDQRKISSVAQIIANKTGRDEKSPEVQKEAKETMQQSRVYVEKGEKDPAALHRLVELERNLKNANIGKTTRTPEKVMKMDKIIEKAVKDGMKKIDLGKNVDNPKDIKKLEKVMNETLNDRTSI